MDDQLADHSEQHLSDTEPHRAGKNDRDKVERPSGDVDERAVGLVQRIAVIHGEPPGQRISSNWCSTNTTKFSTRINCTLPRSPTINQTMANAASIKPMSYQRRMT